MKKITALLTVLCLILCLLPGCSNTAEKAPETTAAPAPVETVAPETEAAAEPVEIIAREMLACQAGHALSFPAFWQPQRSFSHEPGSSFRSFSAQLVLFRFFFRYLPAFCRFVLTARRRLIFSNRGGAPARQKMRLPF